MFCQNCRQFNEEGQNYCRFCGSALLQPQTYQPPNPQPKPYGWASPSSPLHEVGDESSSKEPQQVEPLEKPRQPTQPAQQPHFNSPAHQRGYRCPRCGSTTPPIVRSQISDSGWITFVLMLVFCFPLFFIGLLMTEEQYTCSACFTRIA